MNIELEAGKCYVAENGAKVGPMKPLTFEFFGCGDREWLSNGNYWCGPGLAEQWDLVAECYEEFPRQGANEDLLAAEIAAAEQRTANMIDRPPHYTGHPSGVECIEITEHMNFCRGNAMKYLWRAGEKGDEVEDLKKARWYLDREIARLEAKSA